MRYKPNDIIVWEDEPGILRPGNEYVVSMIREGMRVQEFTLKFKNGRNICIPVIWWETGEPFVKRQSKGGK
jgi:hypothetical protein